MSVFNRLLCCGYFAISFATIPTVLAQTPPAVPAVVAVPQFDLYLADFSAQQLSKLHKVNSQAGYHNQPVFSSDGKTLYFTSQQGQGERSQMDIASFQIESKVVDLFRKTSLSEYSPTLIPGEQALSVVVVEADGQQRLWRLAPTGALGPMLPEVIGVGYHAWGPADDVLLFILGKDEADHQIAYRNNTGEMKTLARNVGRGLAWRPGTSEGYFTEREGNRLRLSLFNSQNVQTSQHLVMLPEQAQDIRWWSKDLLLTSAGAAIYSWQPGKQSWQRWLDLSGACQGTVSRFSFSPDQTQLAFVCQPADAVKKP